MNKKNIKSVFCFIFAFLMTVLTLLIPARAGENGQIPGFFREGLLSDNRPPASLNTLQDEEEIARLLTQGQILLDQGDYNGGGEKLESALKIIEKNSNTVHITHLSGFIADIYMEYRQYEKALFYYEKALSGFTSMQDKKGEGNCTGQIGTVYFELEDWEKALAYYERATALAIETGDLKREGLWTGNTGKVYARNRKYQFALQYYEKALETARRMKDKPSEAVWLGETARAYEDLFQYERAEEFFRQAVKISVEIKDLTGEGIYTQNIGNLYTKNRQYKQALEYLQKARQIALKTGDKKKEGNILISIGNIYENISKYHYAQICYEKAMKIYQNIKDKSGEAVVLGNLGNLHFRLSKFKKALEYIEKGLTLAKSTGDKHQESLLLRYQGNCYRRLHQPEKSLSYYEESLKICREINDSEMEAKCLEDMGFLYRQWGEPQKAVACYKKNIDIYNKIGDKKSKIKQLRNIGDIYIQMGMYDNALKSYSSALVSAKEAGDGADEMLLWGNIGETLENRGSWKKALDYYNQALNIAINIKDKKSEAKYLGQMGNIYVHLGQDEKALDYYKKALSISIEINDKPGEILWSGNIGLVYNNLSLEEKSLDYIQTAFDISRRQKDVKNQQLWLGNLGHIYAEMKGANLDRAQAYYYNAFKIAEEWGDVRGQMIWTGNTAWVFAKSPRQDKALDYFEKTLQIARKIQDDTIQYNCWGNMGIISCNMGNKEKALEYLKKAVDLIEEIPVDTDFDPLTKNFIKEKDLYYKYIISILIEIKEPRQALLYAERQKALCYPSLISSFESSSNIDDIIEKEREIFNSIRFIKREIISANHGEKEFMAKQLQKKREEYKKIISIIKAGSSRYSPWITVNPHTPEEIQNHLLPDQVLIEYYITDEKTYIWTITHSEIEINIINIKKEDLKEESLQLRELLSSLNSDKTELDNKLTSLSRILIHPIQRVIKGKKRLIVIADPVLNPIPFACLKDKEGKYLVENHSVVNSPSSTIFCLLRDRKKETSHKLAIFAYGDPQSIPLDNTHNSPVQMLIPEDISRILIPSPEDNREEIQKIKDICNNKGISCNIYYNKEFNLKNIQEEMKSAGFFHFSASPLLAENPKDAKFSGFIAYSEYIFLTHILEREMNARLVVFSRAREKAEITSGHFPLFCSAFFYAGADNLIAPLWNSDQEATRRLMTEMYNEIFSGKSFAESLRTAQISLLKSGKYSHPACWSSFVLYGN